MELTLENLLTARGFLRKIEQQARLRRAVEQALDLQPLVVATPQQMQEWLETGEIQTPVIDLVSVPNPPPAPESREE